MPLDHDTASSWFARAGANDAGIADAGVAGYFGDHAKVGVPWPRAVRSRERPVVTEVELDALCSGAPHLADVDPRTLFATQPWVVAQHARYYGTGEWERTGTTAADRNQWGNRYPLIHTDRHGRSIILAGHHRCLVALLEGREVRARVLRTGPDPVAVLPRLLVGSTSDLNGHVAVAEPAAAFDAIVLGCTAVVPDADTAVATLRRLGLDATTVDDRCRLAGIDQVRCS